MEDYNGSFTTGEQMIFDVKKLVGDWKADPSTSQKYKFKVLYDAGVWELGAAYQPFDYPVDGITSATTDAPSDNIQDKGSIILIRR